MANRTPTCLALALCVSLVFADDKTMMELTKQAIKLESNRIQEKIDLYTRAINESGNFWLPYHNRAVCYLNHGLWEPAINDASECIRLNPGLAAGYAVRARGFAGKRLFTEADRDMRLALDKSTKDTERVNILNERGSVYFSQRDYPRAIADYEEALKIDETFSKGWNNLGITQRAIGDQEASLKAFDKAIELDPKSARTYANRARVYMSRNDKVRVERELTKAVELDGKDFAARLDRSMFYYISDNLPAAQRDIDGARSILPSNAYIALWSYLIKAKSGKKEEAAAQLRTYLASRRRTTYWPLPIAKAMLGEAKAEDVLQAAKVTDNDVMQREQTAEANFYLSQIAKLAGDTEGEKRLLQECLNQRAPRAHEMAVGQILLTGWTSPLPPPPTPVTPSEGAGAQAVPAAQAVPSPPVGKKATPPSSEVKE